MADGHVLDQATGEDWTLINGDSVEVLRSLPAAAAGLVVTSIPFSSTYTYSPSERDLGNVRSHDEFFDQLAFISDELLRVVAPGRLVCFHVANLPTYANTHGASGRYDFRGDTIHHMVGRGFVYHSEFTIQKNPQAQAQRTKSKGLLFVQMRRDQAALWQAWADYVCVFRVPGENAIPVTDGLDEEEWIEWAAPVWEPTTKDRATFEWSSALDECWHGIRETDVLNVREARENDDERHLCPLQLPVIERCVRLWSNPGEVVVDPFSGIGSTVVGSLRLGRKALGIELKAAYHRAAVRNVQRCERELGAGTLFG
jgi:DNA modification methylase